MESARVKVNDVVRVVAKHSDYFGEVGVVRSLTATGITAHVVLNDGRLVKPRVSSLEVLTMRVEVKPSRAVELSSHAAELRALRKEVAEMKAVMLRLEKLLLDEDGGERMVLVVKSDVRE